MKDCKIDIFSGRYKEFVPKLVIIKEYDRTSENDVRTVIEKLGMLGSKVIVAPDQISTDYILPLEIVAECVNSNDMNVIIILPIFNFFL